jgi:hypothetical protein
MTEFEGFPKIPRFSRPCVITEKIDGTNGQIYWNETCTLMLVGSRSRWITTDNDNHGFARWASDHVEELKTLGPGRHFGEWWGQGIQRNYGLKEKRFSLFNVRRWAPYGTEPKLISVDDKGVEKWQDIAPACCYIVPVIATGEFGTQIVIDSIANLMVGGSYAVPGFLNPEGIIIFHSSGNLLFKKTILNDEKGKGEK